MRRQITQKGPWCFVREAPVRSVAADMVKAFLGEAIVWKRLRHPNFVGLTTAPLQLVSGWMPNGTSTEFVNANPGADRISLLRNPLGAFTVAAD